MVDNRDFVWFGLVSLLNGISTFGGYLNPSCLIVGLLNKPGVDKELIPVPKVLI